ncbi:putative Receptor-type guanylate cyclase gcy-12 [Hypsibius exemplaris]|uniref:Receptor-type guanylate cyclase gcy-12 n=1 Tax=Hypsibius exemplaris TaxID=2072580 RepID=A0A1W0WB64_HYPEX|nr:putative Receptor-type guanylate cyclase gcy-12 [Hypsibius exemplaris]
MSLTASPIEIVTVLNRLTEAFMETIQQFDVIRVGSADGGYMVASGIPTRTELTHVEHIASMALVLRRETASITAGSKSTKTFQIRAGFNSGPCVAGIVGETVPRYFIFGTTVSAVRHLEATGTAGKIHCGQASKLLLEKFQDFVVVPATPATAEDPRETFWLMGKS